MSTINLNLCLWLWHSLRWSEDSSCSISCLFHWNYQQGWRNDKSGCCLRASESAREPRLICVRRCTVTSWATCFNKSMAIKNLPFSFTGCATLCCSRKNHQLWKITRNNARSSKESYLFTAILPSSISLAELKDSSLKSSEIVWFNVCPLFF